MDESQIPLNRYDGHTGDRSPDVEESGARPRKAPCASCPYRKGAPSGVWHPDEYDKLRRYDEETFAQPPQVFMCHQGAGDVCSGWLGHDDPNRLLAVRIGIARGDLHPSCAEYTTAVPLFPSGADAADHGIAELETPGARAQDTIRKLIRSRNLDY